VQLFFGAEPERRVFPEEKLYDSDLSSSAGRTTVTVQGASATTRADTLPMWRRSIELPREPITM
jgi:hypothetical protein